MPPQDGGTQGAHATCGIVDAPAEGRAGEAAAMAAAVLAQCVLGALQRAHAEGEELGGADLARVAIEVPLRTRQGEGGVAAPPRRVGLGPRGEPYPKSGKYWKGGGRGEGGGSGTQKTVYPKWPDQIFPIVKFRFFPTMVTLVWGGGGVSTTPPYNQTEGGGVGTRPWWLALLACGSAYWPLAFEPSAMTSGHPHYCGHPHCHGHPPAWGGGGGIQNATSAHGVLP